MTDVGESVESLTLTAAAAQPGANVVVDPTDADPALEGYQIAFTGARMRVTVTVTSADDSASRTYTLSLHRKLEWADFELGWDARLWAAFRRTDHLWQENATDLGVMHSGSALCAVCARNAMSIATCTSASTHPAASWSTIRTIVGRTRERCRFIHATQPAKPWSAGRTTIPQWGGVKQVALLHILVQPAG